MHVQRMPAATALALSRVKPSFGPALFDAIIGVSVAPGPTETELFRANNPPGGIGEAWCLAGVPMGRFAKPDDIAATIPFLLPEEAGFITDQTTHVDGGASIGKAGFRTRMA